MRLKNDWPRVISTVIFLLALAAVAFAQESNGATESAQQATGFFQELGARLDAWQAWLHSLPVPLYVAAVLSFVIAWVPGFLIFLLCFSAGMFAPTAARVGLWAFALLWFIILLGLFIPPTASDWWWLVALVAIVCILLMVPRPRTAMAK